MRLKLAGDLSRPAGARLAAFGHAAVWPRWKRCLSLADCRMLNAFPTKETSR